MKPKIYLAHPVSGDPKGNALNACAWIQALTLADSTRLYLAPWVAEVLGFDAIGEPITPEFYQRVLDDDCEVVATCQGLLAVGGAWSSGMIQERAVARIVGIPILDLTKFREPSDFALRELRSRAGTVFGGGR